MMKRRLDRPTKVARLAGVDIFIHWSVLAMVPIAWFLVEDWAQAVTGAATLVGLILVHEAGHAYFARKRNLEVLGLVVYPFIGFCTHEASEFEEDHIFVAWGGVAAQAVVLVIAAAVAWILSSLSITAPPYVYPIFLVLITLNIGLIIMNLWPAEPLDGATAWKILRVWRDKVLDRRTRPAPPTSREEPQNVVDLAIRRAQRGSERRKQANQDTGRDGR
ncbi:MAG: hypothetical protein QNJ07_17010 [Woeseiaceae bacterium]|nr:hypothetical protein [Woeseiaceae bacterium]